MIELSLARMEEIEGGVDEKSEYYTGVMCGLAVLLSFTGFFAPFAAAPAAGCLVGLYANYGNFPKYNG
jgi:hypothetical protein